MYTLVRFNDGSEEIYSSKELISKGAPNEKCIVKHKGCKYEAIVIDANDSNEELRKRQYSPNAAVNEIVPIIGKNNSKNTIDLDGLNLEDYYYGTEMNNTATIIEQFQNPAELLRSFDELENSETNSFHDVSTNNELSSPSEFAQDSDSDYDPKEASIASEEIDIEENCSDKAETSHKQSRLSTSLIGCDDEHITVPSSRGKKGDKKVQFCVYCHTKQQKIARHLELRHKNEEDVIKFTQLPPGNPERKKIISQIRNRGNFLFNTNASFNDGELIVCRRPRKIFQKRAKDYKPCSICKGFYSKQTLRLHFRECSGKAPTAKNIISLLSKKTAGRIHPKASRIVRKHLFPVLREDEITRPLRFDELVISFSNRMVDKYKEQRYFDMIRARLRQIGRFLSSIKKLNREISDMTSIYDPKYIDDCLQAINEVARFNEQTSLYEAPTVAFSLGTLLKQMGNFLLIECIKKHDDERLKNTKNFLKLLAQELNININRTVAESQTRIKRKKKTELPSSDDIKKLHNFLAEKQKNALNSLKRKFSMKIWFELAETTLTMVQLFNRRRAGEIERILIEDFHNFEKIDTTAHKDLFDTLDHRCKTIAQKYLRFQIRGKLNRTVSVLLDNKLLESFNVLLEHRSKMKISKDNPFFFGIPGTCKNDIKHLRACTLMRKFAANCGAQHPERLRGTKLRKHIATACIQLNLKEQEVSDLANFMGHAENIHKNIYRQPLLSREIISISRLLEAAQGQEQNIDQIDSSESDSSDSDNESINNIGRRGDIESDEDNDFTLNRKKKRSSIYGKIKRTRWSVAEKTVVKEIFSENFKRRTLPAVHEVQQAIKKYPDLQNRTSPQIRVWIRNQFKGEKNKLF